MTITIPDNQKPIRVDIYLAQIHPEHSRSYWQKKIQNKLVSVNDKHVTKHAELVPGDVIRIEKNPPLNKPRIDAPDVHIIEETDDYIIIDKPVGLIVHPNEHNTHRPSVASWAVQHDARIADVGDDTQLRPGIVHRLDRDVSGVMVIAKTQPFYEHLKAQFQKRTVDKQYKALVHGRDLEQEFELTFRLTRNKKTGKMAALPESHEEGKEARTHCGVIERYTSSTLLDVSPKTGRTHQIRAHLFAYGHPIVGDTLYNSKKYITKLDDRLGRIFLHAHAITFIDLSNAEKTYTVPLPDELESFLRTLKPQ